MNKKSRSDIHRLTKREQFVKVAASGIRFVAPGFVLQKGKEEGTDVRIGLTATKKLGGAVERNRARRRLRALSQAHLLPTAHPYDYVLVAREGIFTRSYADLVQDIEKALKVLKCKKS